MKRRILSLALLSISTLSACGVATAAREPVSRVSVAVEPGPKLAEPIFPKGPDGPITQAERAQAIERLLTELGDHYVFPDKTKAVRAAIRARMAKGEYNAIVMGNALGDALTAHVNAILKDAHFGVVFNRDPEPATQSSSEPTAEELERRKQRAAFFNGGFARVERLPGNIGYLALEGFSGSARAAEAAAAAMQFLAGTGALIIDLRDNHGGSPEMVATLCSYFFDQSVHLNDIYWREGDSTRQYWTSTSVAGPRYLEREVYVLTSSRTASAGEEFAYDLQQLKRATLVGEVTWGGANPGKFISLTPHFSAFIPTGRAINPITKTNWEGTGVKPDIEVKADDALHVAEKKALEKLAQSTSDTLMKQEIEERLSELSKK